MVNGKPAALRLGFGLGLDGFMVGVGDWGVS